MDYLLTHDVSSTGCKAALVTIDGRLVETAYESYPTHYPQPLWSEQDPEDWWQAITQSTKRVLDASGVALDQICGMAFSTTMTNIVVLDEEKNLLRPCIFWMDGRAGEEARYIMRRLGGEKIFTQIIGATASGKDLIPKYLWLKRNEPEVYDQGEYFLDVSGYLLYRATGEMVYEWSVASGLGLFNFKTKKIDTLLMGFFGLDGNKFPPLVKSIDQVGELNKKAADDLGLLPGIPVFGGAGDPMTAAVGSGTVNEGDAYLNLGTSAFIGVLTRKQLTGRRGLATIQSADPDMLMMFGETSTAGASLEWAVRELYGAEAGPDSLAKMDRDVDQAEPGAGGVIFTPWMFGERCPIPDESLRGAFINLSINRTRQQMARAIYEGIAFNLRWILDSIDELYGIKCETLRVLGGGARGLPWLRIIADVTGCKLEVLPDPRERLAVGAALVAAIGLGIYPTFEAIKPLVPIELVIEPDLSHQDTYTKMYAAYRRVYPALRDLYHDLNR
ncbi:MAG: FGGY-family carbohydrate kinase [Anaerolineales bacterium]